MDVALLSAVVSSRRLNPALPLLSSVTVWVDVQDLSSMRQDRAGASATVAAAVGSPVGSVRNKGTAGEWFTAPSDAARPVLRARYNLLTFSEQFDNAAWAKSGSTITANAGVAPDGTTTADTWQVNAGRAITLAAVGLFASTASTQIASTALTLAAASYTASIYVKAGSGLSHVQLRLATTAILGGTSSNTLIRLSDGAIIASDGTAVVTNAGNGWWRIQHTWTPTAGTWYMGLWAWNDTSIASTAGTENYSIWGAQLQTAADHAATGGAYQRIAAATDYDTSNPVWRLYLEPDGVDDWLVSSPLINLGETWWHVGAWRMDAESRSPFSTSNQATTGLTVSNALNWYINTTATDQIVPSPVNVSCVHTLQHSLAAISGRRNAVAGGSVVPFQGSGATRGLALFSLVHTSFSLGLLGRFYGGAWGTGALSASDRAILERYFGNLVGVTIP